jgi:MraZ protein
VEEGPKFFGRHERSLDAKGRIVLPAKFRSQFGTQAYLSQYQDGCLALWTPDAFTTQLAAYAERQGRSSEDRNLARVWASGSQDVELDGQGRVPIPPYLVAYAGLEGSVLVVGALDRVELWSPARWEAVVAPSEHALANPAATAVAVAAGADPQRPGS